MVWVSHICHFLEMPALLAGIEFARMGGKSMPSPSRPSFIHCTMRAMVCLPESMRRAVRGAAKTIILGLRPNVARRRASELLEKIFDCRW